MVYVPVAAVELCALLGLLGFAGTYARGALFSAGIALCVGSIIGEIGNAAGILEWNVSNFDYVAFGLVAMAALFVEGFHLPLGGK